jgi:tRNA threonylcarbamoyladenosine biosynthesis protein TsaB
MYPDAVDIAALAAIAWHKGEAVSPEQALPVYLRDRVVAEPSC